MSTKVTSTGITFSDGTEQTTKSVTRSRFSGGSSYRAANSGTWTNPGGINHIYFYLWGGGGGGSIPNNSYNWIGGGGGGGGGVISGRVPVTDQNYNYTIGSGGSAGGGTGGTGGTSTFAGVTCNGGTGGVTSNTLFPIPGVAGTSTLGNTAGVPHSSYWSNTASPSDWQREQILGPTISTTVDGFGKGGRGASSKASNIAPNSPEAGNGGGIIFWYFDPDVHDE
jgi:hypothetical protein